MQSQPERDALETAYPLEMLGLSTRPYRRLRMRGIRTIDQLTRLSDDDLLAMRGLGLGSLADVHAALQRWQERLLSGDLPPTPPTEDTFPTTASMQQLVDAWLARLPQRSARIVTLRYGLADHPHGPAGEPQTLIAIADGLGVTKQRVWQALQAAHRVLRRPPLQPCTQAHLQALRRYLASRSGHASEWQARGDLPQHLSLGGLDPLIACRVLAAIQPGIRWHHERGLRLDATNPPDATP